MKSIPVSTNGLLCAFFVWLAVTPGNVAAGEHSSAFLVQAEKARTAWSLIASMSSVNTPMSASDKEKLEAILSQVSFHASAFSQDMVCYLSGRARYSAEEKDTATVNFISAIAIPEAIESIIALFEMDEQHRLLYTQCLGDLLPISVWRRQNDSIKSEYVGLPKPARPTVPELDGKTLFEVACCFEKAGQYEFAWRAYVEAVYAVFPPAWLQENPDENWLSPQVAKYWIRAAQCARQAKRQQLAQSFLLKAAIFGSSDMYKEAQAIALQWEKEPDENRASLPTINQEIARKALLRIVQLYREMNIHPRAWALIEANPTMFNNPGELRKQIEREWLLVVKDASRAANKVVLYGHEVFPQGDPLQVTIPWCLSDEAIASAKDAIGKAIHTKTTKKKSP